MTTLDIVAAAAFLRIHPDTLRERAAAGIIPGGKPGKEWVFLEEDLAAYLRSLYPCHSIGAQVRTFGTSASDDVAAPDFEKALAQATERKRSSSTPNLKLLSGASGKAASDSPTRYRPGSRRKTAAGKS